MGPTRTLLTRPRLTAIATGLALTAALLWLDVSGREPVADLVQRAESLLYDVRLNATLPETAPADDQIVIVAIDERSLREQGHWPWPRDRLAEMTRRMLDGGAAVIGFDIMFAEAEESGAERLLQRLGDHPQLRQAVAALAKPFGNDRSFAHSLQGGDIVLGYTFRNDSAEASGSLPPPLAKVGAGRHAMIGEMPNYTGPLPLLLSAAGHGGFVTTTPDRDGILRRSPLLIRYQDRIYGSLSLEIARLFYLLDDVGINFARVGDGDAVESVELGSTVIPTDAMGRVIIPYRGTSPAFRYLSATDVLSGRIDPARFENKIVLVGATALGLSDRVATPVQNVFPGVEVHASLIKGILDRHFPVEPSWVRGANLMLMLATGALLAVLLPWLGPLLQVTVAGGVAAAVVAANFWLWQDKGLVLQLALPLALVAALVTFNLAFGFLTEARQRSRLKDMFGHYVPPPLVEQMLRRPEWVTTDGESRELTVLFADIRNFTSISESLSPNELKKLLNSFFTPMTRIIFDRHGTIDKYVGDMIMAFWGAPLPDAHHARHGVEAALAMLAEVETMKADFRGRGLPEINIGVGLNTGVMNVGDMGSEFRRAYTVIGDAVNLASRIEGLTKYYGAGAVIGEETYNQLDGILCRKLDRVRVKGKRQGVEVYQPLCPLASASEALVREVADHDHALELYWARHWDAAQASFQRLQAQAPDTRIYALYLERIAEIRHRDLPADWDGVYERRSK